jgi:hypothetical protein
MKNGKWKMEMENGKCPPMPSAKGLTIDATRP